MRAEYTTNGPFRRHHSSSSSMLEILNQAFHNFKATLPPAPKDWMHRGRDLSFISLLEQLILELISRLAMCYWIFHGVKWPAIWSTISSGYPDASRNSYGKFPDITILPSHDVGNGVGHGASHGVWSNVWVSSLKRLSVSLCSYRAARAAKDLTFRLRSACDVLAVLNVAYKCLRLGGLEN